MGRSESKVDEVRLALALSGIETAQRRRQDEKQKK